MSPLFLDVIACLDIQSLEIKKMVCTLDPFAFNFIIHLDLLVYDKLRKNVPVHRGYLYQICNLSKKSNRTLITS